MKTAWVALIAAVLLFISGCVTRPDWIEATLVTVDVTGVWRGQETRPEARSIAFELHQEGPRVTGTVSFIGLTIQSTGLATASGPLAGSVGGDVFDFTVSGDNGVWTGRLTVNDEDQMAGVIRWLDGRTYNLLLRRVDAPASPRRQGP